MPNDSNDDDSSGMSALTNLVAQLNDVETALLTSAGQRGNTINKDLLKHLAVLKLQLLTDDSIGCETPVSNTRASTVGTSRQPRRGLGANSVGGNSRGSGGHSRGSHGRSRAPRQARKSQLASNVLHLPKGSHHRRRSEHYRRRDDDDDYDDYDDDYDDVPEIEIPFMRRDDDAVSTLHSSPSAIANAIADARNLRKSKAAEDKEFDNAGYQPDLVKEIRRGPELLSTTLWSLFAHLVTFAIPDFMICKTGVQAKKAWREKVAIFWILIFFSCLFVVMVTAIPVYICAPSRDYFDIDQLGEKGLTTVFGNVYDLEAYMDLHPGGIYTLEKFIGADASRIFPRLPPTELPAFCLSDRLKSNETIFNETNILGLQNLTCLITEAEIDKIGEPDACHTSFAGIEAMDEKLGEYKQGKLVVNAWDIGMNGLPDGTQAIRIGLDVYNVTNYLNSLE